MRGYLRHGIHLSTGNIAVPAQNNAVITATLLLLCPRVDRRPKGLQSGKQQGRRSFREGRRYTGKEEKGAWPHALRIPSHKTDILQGENYMTLRRGRWLPLAAVLMLALTMLPPVTSTHAQGGRTFPETGKTVSGRFLDYWNTHGGLAQQGYPITNTMQEVSDTDGKTYTVQYFERSFFEQPPENAAPNDVLLSLLGNFLYKQKSPSGAPGQSPNTAAPSRLF